MAVSHDPIQPDAPYAMVLWDFDGTLASTSGDVWGSLNYAAQKRHRSFPFGFEDDDEHLAWPMATLFASLVPAPDPADLADFERDVRVHYRSISMHPCTDLYPGIRALLEELHARGVVNRIATNKPKGRSSACSPSKAGPPSLMGGSAAIPGPMAKSSRRPRWSGRPWGSRGSVPNGA